MGARAKERGDAAVRRKDFQEAVACYSEAIEQIDGRELPSLWCNRALAHLHLEAWEAAEADASAVLAGSCEEKLRVKALYRRALALEALQRLEEAEVDINLALKAAPSNAGIAEAARRLRARRSSPVNSWVPGQPYHSPAVRRLATDIPGSQLGQLGANAEELCIRFDNGMAVQVHGQTGSLMAIRQRVMARSDAFQLGDGLQAEYDIGGNLVRLYAKFAQDLEGPYVSFNSDSTLSLRETCCYKAGRVLSKLQSDIPSSFIADAMRQLIIPVKRAIDMGLARNEEALCTAHGVDPNLVPAAELARLEQPTPVAPPVLKVLPPVGPPFKASDHFQGALPGWAFKLGSMGLGYYQESFAKSAVLGDGSWEALLEAPPQGLVGPAWVGPFASKALPSAAPERNDVQAPPPQETPQGSAVRPEYPTPQRLFDLQGVWVDDKEGTPVGQIQGGCVVWHPSFNCRPTKLHETPGGVEMEMEGKIYTATVQVGQETKLHWNDGEVWLRRSGAPDEKTWVLECEHLWPPNR